MILAIALLLMLTACLVLVAFIAVGIYKKRLLLFKKTEAAESGVSFHGNVISFSNPVLDHKPVRFFSSYINIKIFLSYNGFDALISDYQCLSRDNEKRYNFKYLG